MAAPLFTNASFHHPIQVLAHENNNPDFVVTVPKERALTCTSLMIKRAFQAQPTSANITFKVQFPPNIHVSRKTIVKFIGMIAPKSLSTPPALFEETELVPVAYLASHFDDKGRLKAISEQIESYPLAFGKIELLGKAATLVPEERFLVPLAQTICKLASSLDQEETERAKGLLRWALTKLAVIPSLEVTSKPIPDWVVDEISATEVIIDSLKFSSWTLENFPRALHGRVRTLSLAFTNLALDRFISFSSVTKVNLKQAQITTLDSLSSFPCLNSLELNDCRLAPGLDLSPLKTSPNLQSLSLRATNVKDLRVLSFLGLNELSLDKCGEIEDFAPLELISKLRSLNLDGTLFERFSEKASLPLEALNLKDTKFYNLANLSFARQTLRALNLMNCRVADFSPLANFPELSRLFLGGELKDLCFLPQLKKLSFLSITHTTGSLETGSLSDCENLRELYLFNAPVTSLQFLNGAIKLEILSISLGGNLTGQFEYLKQCPSLKQLTLWGCGTPSDEIIDHLRRLGVELRIA